MAAHAVCQLQEPPQGQLSLTSRHLLLVLLQISSGRHAQIHCIAFQAQMGSDASAVCGTLHHAAHDDYSGAQADWPRVIKRPDAETKVATCVETDGHCWLTEKADPALNRRHRDNTISTICTGYYTQCLTLSLCTRPMYMLY